MTTLSPAERSYIVSGLSSGTPTRLDGRALLSPRPISISYGDAPQANGSARVCIEGGTEIIAGIRLEVGDAEPVDGKGKGRATGKEGWRTKIEVDVTPQAYPHLSQQALTILSAQFTSLLSDHFVPSIPPLSILPTKYFIPHLQLTVISASSGSIYTALFIAARSAFCDLRIPKTKSIGWEGNVSESVEAARETDLSGIKAAVRGRNGAGRGERGRVGGDEWDLDLSGGGLVHMMGRERLPVLVTLNLVPDSQAFFLDATPQEESACPDRLHLCFSNNAQTICGMRLEGDNGLAVSRTRSLVSEGQTLAQEMIRSLNSQIEKAI